MTQESTTAEDHCLPWALVGGGGGGGGGGAGGGGAGGGSGAGLFDGGLRSKLFMGVLILTGLAHLIVAFAPEPPDVERRLVEVAMVLPGSTLEGLDRAYQDAAFSSERGRRRTLDAVLDVVGPSDIRRGFARLLVTADTSGAEFVRSMKHYQRQLRRAGLGEFKDTDLRAARHGDAPSESVVLGIIVSQPTTVGPPIEGDTRAARQLLRRLRTTDPDDSPAVLYLYYGPDPGDTLEAGEAHRMLDTLSRRPRQDG